jgi:hypothetical protein
VLDALGEHHATFKADRHRRAPMLRRGEARVQDLWGPVSRSTLRIFRAEAYERRFPYWWD